MNETQVGRVQLTYFAKVNVGAAEMIVRPVGLGVDMMSSSIEAMKLGQIMQHTIRWRAGRV
jgi:hypothetical protein